MLYSSLQALESLSRLMLIASLRTDDGSALSQWLRTRSFGSWFHEPLRSKQSHVIGFHLLARGQSSF